MDYFYSRRVLQSGLTIVEIHQPHLHTGSIAVYIKAGSRYETPSDNGLSHFLEHMVFRGTKKHKDAFALNLAVEEIGGTLFAATSPDSTEYGLSLPSENLANGVGLLAEVITQPIFSSIEVERRVITEEKKEDLDENHQDIDIDFLSRSRLWPGHSLGQSVIGPMKNIQAFTVDDLKRYLKTRYVAKNTVVCLSGAYDPDVVPDIVNEAFVLVPGSETPPAEFNTLVPGEGPTVQHVNKPGSQTQLRVAFNAFGENDKDRTALSILMGILDDGMSTRLHRRIFDELGLAYNIGADAELYADAGAINIDASSSHDKVAEIMTQISFLVAELKESEVSEEELQKAKNREIWALKDFLDDPNSMGAWYGEQELNHRPPLLENRIRDTQTINAQDIMRVAKRVFTNSNIHVTSVGTQNETAIGAIEKAAASFS